MAVDRQVEFLIERRSDADRARPDAPGAVLHGYHYALLCTQLAQDTVRFDGPRLLREAAEIAFYRWLDRRWREHGARGNQERIGAARAAWRATGLGRVVFSDVRADGLTATMDRSLVDACWVRRWARPDEPVNYIAQGFVAAVAALVNDLPPGLYTVEETASLARGDAASVFQAAIK